MAMPTFTMRQLLEAGVHFGHQKHRWNPKMSSYIFGDRNGVHIIDLQQTVPLLYRALETTRDVVAAGGRVLFVGTKRQASEPVTEAARRCGQYYVNHRWLGGMLTNWKTISNSIKRLKDLDEQLSEENLGLTKKEMLKLTRERDKLERALGGIKEMGDLPNLMVVIDTNKEDIAVKEAVKLDIPVVAIIDSNSDPANITHPIPGNDDALRAINLYCELFSRAVLDGIQQEMAADGADLGEAEELAAEELPEAEPQAAMETPAADTPAAESSAEQSAEAPAEVPVETAPEEVVEAVAETSAEVPAEAPAETSEKASEEASEEASAAGV
ncbi:MAG: 30S ribosomal protein S2 [Rhodospirillaceae bacterium]|jgi:small subunit ribosomal protein S2|nr:30S ribosomal protein S2 [Rhodospirillaceae bacterium]MDP6621609.1 30S ribosomal protein S2 [Alphaproteobacteria bacterium]|tara:strand:+ start:1361 stop:2341 length:981 start_codon:yes stop_codon:yes gene_type:complete